MSTQTSLETLSVDTLKGVGPKLSQRLARLNVYTVADLLWHLPARYQDRTRVTPIGSLQPGMDAVIEAEVQLTEISGRRKPMLLCRLHDGSGPLTLRFFHFSAALRNSLSKGNRLRCYGEVRNGAASLEMFHPEHQRLDGTETVSPEPYLTPIYPTTEGVHQLTLRGLIERALAQLENTPLAEHLPPELLTRLKLSTLNDAILLLHRPPPEAEAELLHGRHPALQRLAFEELLAHQLSLRELRNQVRAETAPALISEIGLTQRFLANLPFTPTSAQQRVIGEIHADLVNSQPMLRLVQGDVGSGKTLVAAAAALQAIETGCQAAIMAPTELLGEQHYRNFRSWLEPLGLQVAWLASKIKGKAREAVLAALRDGSAQVAVGTHALFQEDVVFKNLALVVIDEQHRFGVHQRLALREKGRQGHYSPHQLIMTATPIPRTLAMSAYADLDTSIIDELPPGRTPVTTVAIPATRRGEVIERIRLACRAGRQAYWVCTLIEESEVLQAEAAEDTAARLTEALPELSVALVHGRMKASEKDTVMSAFKAGELDLLVATTVIEVGVDIANASLMIIENAERLGLAQLHQLRGRIGRGSIESHCVLLYQAPLSEQARSRLRILRESNDGFVIARRDLELRGPGEVLGTRQTGELSFRTADLLRDEDLLPNIRRTADWLLRDYPASAEAIVQRWIGQRQAYGVV